MKLSSLKKQYNNCANGAVFLIVKASFFLIVFLSLTISLFACSDKQSTLLETKNNIEIKLNESQILYNEIIIGEPSNKTIDNKTYEFHDLIVLFDDASNLDYQTVWQALTIINEYNLTADCFENYNIVFREYVQYQNDLYSLKTKYEVEKKNDYSFSYITNTLNRPELPYVGMDEELINYTLLGPYAERTRTAHDVRHEHFYTYHYTFKDNGTITYTVDCDEHHKVTNVTDWSDVHVKR